MTRRLLSHECSARDTIARVDATWIEEGPWPSPDWDKPGIYVRSRCPCCGYVVNALVGKVAR